VTGPSGATGPTGSFEPSSLFAWSADEQPLDPADGIGPPVEFTDAEVVGSALSFVAPADINVLEAGYYYISWDVYKTGYDCAFALFYDATSGPGMLAGSNYGAMAHDEKFHGQAISYLAAGGVLTLNRIDSLYNQTILNKIGDETLVTGASIVIIKIG